MYWSSKSGTFCIDQEISIKDQKPNYLQFLSSYTNTYRPRFSFLISHQSISTLQRHEVPFDAGKDRTTM